MLCLQNFLWDEEEKNFDQVNGLGMKADLEKQTEFFSCVCL